MSDKLVVEIDSKDAEVAMRNLDRLTTAAEQMGKAFENTRGATSALRELRLMLTGIKGQGSSLDELKNSIQSLNSTADSLKRSFAGSVGQLGRVFKNEMAELKSIVQETGLGVGRAAAKGIEDGMAEAPAAIRKQGRTIAAAAKAEATRIYEAMVAGQANAKIKDVGALFKLDEAGATLSPYHKQVLENWKKSSAETFRAMKTQLATEREQLEGQVKAENAALQSALKRMEDESKTRNASLTSIYRSSLARGNSSISQVRTALKAESAQLQATVKSENDALQTALQSMESNSRDKAKSLAAIYRDSLGRGNFAMAQVKSKLKAESSELQAAVKAEESELQRALQAMETSDKLRKSSLAEIYAGSLKRGDQGIARVKAQLREQADNIIQTNKTELARVQAQVAAATNNAGGLYQKYSPQSGMAGPVVDPTKIGQVNQLSKAFKQLTIDGNDAHSMARGLASGFNLLWLTWGNLAPLFAGASISFGIKKTFDIGSEVEYQIKMMETLGQTTQTQGRVIRQALRDIDQSTQFSLVELSQAMVRLGQAGKTPAEALEILRPAADLASVGMVDLKTSTDLLIQTQALFGKSTADVGKIAAQVFEITKSGVLNVEDIGDSMKYASEANTRFGKSVEETLTILGALAQAGIKGSSAGTAYINFLRDLNGRSGPAVSALKALEKATGSTIEVFKKTGEQRSAVDIFNDIATAADKLNAKDADKLLAKIFSDRGGRTFFAMVRDGTIDLNKMVDKLKDVDPNSLFMAAKGLMDTTKGALNILQGAMVGALDKVFEANETQFKTFITDITAAINSPEFATAIHGMVGAVSGLYESIKTLMPVLTTLGTAWAVFKAASIGVSIFQGLAVAIAGMAPVLGMTIKSIAQTTGALITSTAAWSANGVAMIGNVAASRAAATGMDAVGVAAARTAATTAVAGVGMRGLSVVLGFLANPIVGIIATLGLLGAAFWSAKSDAEGATAGIAAAVISNGKINIGQWNEEIRKLRERNSLMGQSDAYTPLESGINEARTKLAKESAEYMTILEKYESESKGASARQQEVLDARYGRVLESKMKSIRKEQEAINQARDAIDSARMKDLSAREEAERQQRAKQQARAKVQGDIEIPGGGGGFGGPRNPNPASQHTPPVYRTWYDENFEAIKQITDAQGQYMKTMYDQGKVSVDEYYGYLENKASMAAQLEREHLQEQIKVFSADPRSAKAAKEASAKLSALWFKTEAEKVELAAQYNKALQETLSIQQQIEIFSRNYNEKLRGDGTDIMSIQRGGAAVEAYRAELQVRQDFLKESERIEKDFARKSIGLSEEGLETQRALMQTALDDLRAKETEALQIVRDHETLKAQERMNPLNGVRSALEDYTRQAQDLAGLTKTATGSMLTNLEDAFVQLATTGKVSFKDMANSIMADLARIAARQAMLGLASQVLGSLGGFNIAAGPQASGAITSPVYGASATPTMLGPLPSAKGNVFMNSPSLSSFSNQVHDRPQLFAFAKGAGVFGEAGPEAIMPLTRGADGNLGVRANGGGETNVNIEIVNNGSPVQATTTQSTAPDGTKLVKVLLEAVAGDVRGRGKIYQAIKQTA